MVKKTGGAGKNNKPGGYLGLGEISPDTYLDL
jgi:hypothetical protein